MTYLRVRWIHKFPDEPVMLYSELDEARLEVRSVELFRNGESGHADRTGSKGKTVLSEKPIPSLSEIAADPQFEPVEITKAEFEVLWERSQETV